MKEETKNNGHLVITNPWQKEQEIKITVPEGYEIDRENSTFECIKFKKKNKWRDSGEKIDGYWIGEDSCIYYLSVGTFKNNVFYTKKQAKSALAMAQISQIIANDERFGGPVTDDEWECNDVEKYVIQRLQNNIMCGLTFTANQFLAFHTKEQRDLFLKENKDLVKDYLMID